MWLATTESSQLSFGVTGEFCVFGEGSKEVITLPDRLNMTTQRSSFASWTRGGQSRKYICGSGTDNLVFTEHKTLARLGIQAPTGPLVNTAAPTGNQIGYQVIGGGGLTGNIILYLRFYDELNGRRSPLSGGSPITAFANQGVSFSAVPANPDSPDVGVTHVEVWASQDGGLPRFWFRRDIGASTFSGNSTSLGEAETETLTLLPRCKYNVMYHDRHVLAGDDRHPDRVYFSVSGDPENFAGLWISTRQGEPVIGLFVVRDILIVQCPTIHYMVQGYDENDIRMDVLEPYIGGLGHHTMTPWNDMVVIPGTLDWYLCDGTSMKPLGAGMFDETWRRSIIENDYTSNTWATTDVSVGCVEFCIRDKNVSIYGYPKATPQVYFSSWILDLRGDSPDLMFDITPFDRSAGANLALPGYFQPQAYVANLNGKVYRKNRAASGDGAVAVDYMFHTNHQVVVEPIDTEDCVRFVKAWAVIASDFADINMDIFAGNEYAWRSASPTDTQAVAAQLKEQQVGADIYYYVSNDRKLMPLSRSAGSAISMRIRCSVTGIDPPFPLSLQPAFGPFVFKGWGTDFSGDGSQSRGPEAIKVD